jgi:hypothetical protein
MLQPLPDDPAKLAVGLPPFLLAQARLDDPAALHGQPHRRLVGVPVS